MEGMSSGRAGNRSVGCCASFPGTVTSFLYVSYIILIDIFSIDRGFSKPIPTYIDLIISKIPRT